MREYRFIRGFLLLLMIILSASVSADMWDGFPVILWLQQHKIICNDGRNDCTNFERTEEAMKDLGATHIYVHLMGDRFGYLQWFLKSTKDTDIKVCALLRARCYGSYPYSFDCPAWADNLSKTSLQYPNLECSP